ncbi:MAG TPA: hypothetical protein VHQ00_09940 [Chloroflexota bacterium]|nr:hypothetical protein [Chloroflexota bacterium]
MAVQLKPDVQELLLEELKAFAASIPDQERPAGFGALQDAVEQGELPDSLLGPVGNLLEVGLQTGRIRQFHRAPGEQALLRLFAQTPNGQAHARAVAEVNSALERLAGQEVESLRVVMRVPGSYLLQIGTDACEITLRFTPDGAGVESVAVGV